MQVLYTLNSIGIFETYTSESQIDELSKQIKMFAQRQQVSIGKNFDLHRLRAGFLTGEFFSIIFNGEKEISKDIQKIIIAVPHIISSPTIITWHCVLAKQAKATIQLLFEEKRVDQAWNKISKLKTLCAQFVLKNFRGNFTQGFHTFLERTPSCEFFEIINNSLPNEESIRKEISLFSDCNLVKYQTSHIPTPCYIHHSQNRWIFLGKNLPDLKSFELNLTLSIFVLNIFVSFGIAELTNLRDKYADIFQTRNPHILDLNEQLISFKQLYYPCHGNIHELCEMPSIPINHSMDFVDTTDKSLVKFFLIKLQTQSTFMVQHSKFLENIAQSFNSSYIDKTNLDSQNTMLEYSKITQKLTEKMEYWTKIIIVLTVITTFFSIIPYWDNLCKWGHWINAYRQELIIYLSKQIYQLLYS